MSKETDHGALEVRFKGLRHKGLSTATEGRKIG